MLGSKGIKESMSKSSYGEGSNELVQRPGYSTTEIIHATNVT